MASEEDNPLELIPRVPLPELGTLGGKDNEPRMAGGYQPTPEAPLRILHLEDDPKDAKLIRAVLETEGIACAANCVRTRIDFVAALEGGEVDLVLSDFSMPGFDGLSAAGLVRRGWPSIPFIFVSGTLGEDRGAAAIESGAADYVLKDDLVRLPPAVRRAMKILEPEPRIIRDLSAVHTLAMDQLPVDGRWQTEAQLIGLTRLGNQTDGVYRDLVIAGFCEVRLVPILCHVTDAADFMRMYRTTWKRRRAYGEHSA